MGNKYMEQETKEIIGEYVISKVTSVDKKHYNGIYEDSWNIGYNVTLTNVKNPFDYFLQYVPKDAFSEDQFKVGRVIELVE